MTDEKTIATVDESPTPRRRTGIKNLLPGLPERGKIKIGQKGQTRKSQHGNEFQMPAKLDHFIVTSLERGEDNNFRRDEHVHRDVLGTDKPTEIPIVLIYDEIDLNFQTRYAAYKGRHLWCTGDGVEARRMTNKGDPNQGTPPQYEQVQCPCHRQDPAYTGKDKCKINGTLSVMIQGAEAIGGVWKLRTTSYNSVVGILSSLQLIQRITGGPLAGIPLTLTLSPKAVTDPVQGGQQTVYVVGIEYRGQMESLRDEGHQILLNRHQHGVRIQHIEDEARQLLELAPRNYAGPDSVDDDLDEFYPEAAKDRDSVVDEAPAAGTGGGAPGGASGGPSGGGADALNATVADSEDDTQGRTLDGSASEGEDAGDDEGGEGGQRIAGRKTYWVDIHSGDKAIIEKGQPIPEHGETVSKKQYESMIAEAEGSEPEGGEPEGGESEPDNGGQRESHAGDGPLGDIF